MTKKKVVLVIISLKKFRLLTGLRDGVNHKNYKNLKIKKKKKSRIGELCR